MREVKNHLPRRTVLAALGGILLTFTVSPSRAAEGPIRLGVNPGPTAEIGDVVAKIAKAKGLEVKVIEFSDWVTINAAVDAGEIDVNLFQHKPFLNAAIKAHGFKLAPVGPVAVLPVGLFSNKVKSAAEVPDGATVAIANDPVNAARGLRLFQILGLIKLKPGVGDGATLSDIVENPKHLKFLELEAAQLPRALDDAVIAQQSFTYLLASGRDPKGALATDGIGDQYYALEYVASAAHANDARIRKFVEVAHAPEVRQFIIDHFKGVIVPSW